jgi:hypothetical protein
VPDSTDNSLAKLGRMGMTIPNPKRSIKMVKNRIAIRRSFIIVYITPSLGAAHDSFKGMYIDSLA